MLEKRLKEIVTPKLPHDVKARQLSEIKANVSQRKPVQYVVPKVLTLMATVVAIVILLFVIGTVTPTPEQISQSSPTLTNIVKGTALENEKPKKLLNITSVFYSEKIVSTDRQALKVYENILANAPTEPFSWDKKQLNPSTDYLFELENGQTVYLKAVVEVEGGEFFVINTDTMERYVLDYGQKNAFWDAYDNVFLVNDSTPLWPIITITFILIYSIIREIVEKRVYKKAAPEHTVPTWLNVLFFGTFSFVITFHEVWIGAFHFGFIAVFVNAAIVFYQFVQKSFFNLALTTFEILKPVFLVNLFIVLFYFV